MIFYVILLLIFVICYMVKSHFNYWKNAQVDGPKPMVIFGNMFQFFMAKKHFGEIYDEMYKKFNKAAYVGMYRFSTASILVRDLELVKSVLVENFSSFHDNDFELNEKIDPLLSKSSFFARDEKWKLYRSHISPLFTAAKMKTIFPFIQSASDKLVKYIDRTNKLNSNGFEAKELFAKYTIESVASCGFGLEAKAFNDEESIFVKNSRKVFEVSTFQQIRLMLAQFVPAINKIVNLPFLPKEVDDWLRSIVGQVVSQRDNGIKQRTDFLQQILDARVKSKIDEESVVGHALTFLLEGFETSSITLTYCLYELAKNPEIKHRVQSEIDAALKNCNGQLTSDVVLSLSYMDQVIHETLRMHNPVFALARICTKEFKLPPQYPGSKDGPTVALGTPIVIPIYAIQHDSKYYPNPLVFDPNRFSETEANARNKYAFLGFGEGPRICLGMKFGLMQVKTALINVLSNYNVKMSSKTIEPLTFSKQSLMLTCEDGIWLQFVKRNL